MQFDRERFEQGLQIFEELLEADTELCCERDASREEFFRGPGPAVGDLEGDLAARRHLEWFLFERVSPRTGQLGVEDLLARWREAAGAFEPELVLHEPCYLESAVGVYEVCAAEDSPALELRDLAALAAYRVDEAEAAQVLTEGDLVVGRLYPQGGGLHRISSAAGYFRNPELLTALESDLSVLREAHDLPVLHFAQLELEGMFWGDVSAPLQGTDPIGQAEAFFLESGLEAEEIEALFEGLRALPPEPDTKILGGGDLLGGILDQLAFHTEIDLGEARRLLLAAWIELAQAGPPGDEPEEVRLERLDPRAAMEEFDAERASGVDVEESFRRLEARLGLEPDPSDDEATVPDFPGVVGAMIEEFLWEAGLDGGGADERYACLRGLGYFTRNVGVFENLSERDLIAYAAWWVVEERSLGSADEARNLVAALRGFCDWLADKQHIGVFEGFAARLDGLAESLPRVLAVNCELARPDQGTVGELFVFMEGTAGGAARLARRDGSELSCTIGSPAGELATGDLLRVADASEDEPRVLCCYPAEAAELMRRQPTEEPPA